MWFAALVAGAGVAINPRRFSLVEGCAGNVGYDELSGDGPAGPEDCSGPADRRAS
jgi:hypothetical protein